MSTKPSSPELRPNRYDALVVLVVLALAAALALSLIHISEPTRRS